jgi:hypothetical protein
MDADRLVIWCLGVLLGVLLRECFEEGWSVDDE